MPDRHGNPAPIRLGMCALRDAHCALREAHRAFTLIELLVVVAIIAMLLAMLMPALDRALYQAELAVCGSRLDTIATGAVTYAMDHKRAYPYRRGVHNPKAGYFYLAEMLSNPDHYHTGASVYSTQLADPANQVDDRPMLLPYMGHKSFADPLSPDIDLSIEANPNDSYVMASYALRFGWQFTGQTAMARIGTRWSFGPDSFSILASDRDDCTRNHNIMTTHPDRKGYLVPQLDPYGAVTDFAISRWQAPVYPLPAPTIDRGELDMNFAYEDGSVRRLADVKAADPLDPDDDERFTAVPRYNYGSSAIDEWMSTPRE